MKSTRKLVMTAMLGAIATILMLLEFPVPLMPFFVKMDISELPALIASFAIGPVAGALVCLIKNVLNLLHTQTAGIGELCNFLLGIALVLPAGLIYRTHKTRKGALVGCAVGAVAMALFSLPVNYFISYPFYAKLMPLNEILGMYQAINPNVNGLLAALLIFNVPFTFIKGLLDSVITFFIYKPLSRFIKGKEE